MNYCTTIPSPPHFPSCLPSHFQQLPIPLPYTFLPSLPTISLPIFFLTSFLSLPATFPTILLKFSQFFSQSQPTSHPPTNSASLPTFLLHFSPQPILLPFSPLFPHPFPLAFFPPCPFPTSHPRSQFLQLGSRRARHEISINSRFFDGHVELFWEKMKFHGKRCFLEFFFFFDTMMRNLQYRGWKWGKMYWVFPS